MALGEAILTCLAERPMTGYELAKTFDTSIGYFWRAGHPQIYRELAKLRTDGFASARAVQQTDRPNKVLYTITAAGLERLLAWSGEEAERPPIRDDMVVKLYALDHVDIGALRRQIRARLEDHRKRLALFERIAATRYAHEPMQRAQVGKLLGLRLGLISERGWITWCEAALGSLARLEGQSSGAP